MSGLLANGWVSSNTSKLVWPCVMMLHGWCLRCLFAAMEIVSLGKGRYHLGLCCVFKKLARVTVLVACPGMFPGALPSLQQVGLLQQQPLVQQYVSCCAVVWENGD